MDVLDKPMKSYNEYANVWDWMRNNGYPDIKQRQITRRSPRQVARDFAGRKTDVEKLAIDIAKVAGRRVE